MQKEGRIRWIPLRPSTSTSPTVRPLPWNGTTVAVERSDYRHVYDELWTLSKEIPEAISTAGLLLNATQHPGYPHAVDLSEAQSAALRRAIDDSKPYGRSEEPNALCSLDP